jgi:hypothetical protein
MYNEPPSEKDKRKLLKTCIVGKYNIYLYEMGAFGESFCPVSQRVEMNYIFSDNGRTLCSSLILFEQLNCIELIGFFWAIYGYRTADSC